MSDEEFIKNLLDGSYIKRWRKNDCSNEFQVTMGAQVVKMKNGRSDGT